MKKITSRQNPEIKSIAQLHHKKYRIAQGQFIAEGLRVIKTLIESGHEPIVLYVQEHMLDHATELVPENVITIVTDEVIKKISTATTPSGLLGIFYLPPQPSLGKLSPGLVLTNIADPGNMGTLIRSCAAMDGKTVVCIKGTDPWSPKVVQASAGTIGMLNIFQLSWNELIEHKENIQLCALVVSGGNKPEDINLDNTLLVVGSEAHGIPQEWINQCEQKLTIPMPGNTESLNAAVAGSIALYLIQVK
jgi:TrmH family RNA methyltransferase